jgi:hypothetical protein
MFMVDAVMVVGLRTGWFGLKDVCEGFSRDVIKQLSPADKHPA